MTSATDQNEAYRQTQFQIYNLQETILNSTRNRDQKETEAAGSNSNLKTSKRLYANVQIPVTVNCNRVLEYVKENYGSNRRHLGVLQYHPWKTGSFNEQDLEHRENVYPYDYMQYELPSPFLPPFSSNDINCLVTVRITFEDIRCLLSGIGNSRLNNLEIWGTGIYTDDSDILLVLKHCGVVPSTNADLRTPANMSNPDDVNGSIPPDNIEFDLSVDILLLPPLQKYSSSERHDVKSREWNTWHDGLSFGIHSVTVILRDDSIHNINSDERITSIKW